MRYPLRQEDSMKTKVKKKQLWLPYVLIAPLMIWLLVTVFIPVVNVFIPFGSNTPQLAA